MNVRQHLAENPTCLAPLAGWSDSIFRRLCKRAGAGWVFTEMVSSDGVLHRQSKTMEFIEFCESERPISIQLYGGNSEVMARAAEMLAFHRPDGLDLNFGCPVKKVIKTGAGSALLRDLPRMTEIVRRVVAAVDLPVSAKIRAGWEEDHAVEIALALEDAGVQMVTVHARTQAMKFSGKADWCIIQRVKAAVRIPVIGNGDVRSAVDAEQMVRQTGCDGIMIGRGSQGNPWIFSQVRARLAGLPVPSEPTAEEVDRTLLEHAAEMVEHYGEKRAMYMMRKHLLCYLRGRPLFNRYRSMLVNSNSWTALRDNLLVLRLAGQRFDDMLNTESDR
ncbi:MAG TPA: tRNA dihydrouridine synthase DusB [bacterium]|nr:tRNA dihydrouridine synthase DusB [bacterium]